MDFNQYGYIRIGTAVPDIRIADVDRNVIRISALASQAYKQGVQVLVMPELCITGYTCADLFSNKTLLSAALSGLVMLKEASKHWKGMAVALGLQIRYGSALYNCAAVIYEGNIKGIVPKTYLPNYSEFYEKRWFASGRELPLNSYLKIEDTMVPFGTDLLFEIADGNKLGIEICEDMWTPLPPSTYAALGGATVILNLSASNELAAKHDYLRSLIKSRSAALQCVYAYASAGIGESSTDVVYAGNAIIAENGSILKESPRFIGKELIEIADVDLEIIEHERCFKGSFNDNAVGSLGIPDYRIVPVSVCTSSCSAQDKLERSIAADPFVPSNALQREIRCEEIVNIQVAGLMQRIKATGIKKLVVGISGGLDSTLALLVASEAFRRLDIHSENIIGITMPGFGTSGRTYDNAVKLINHLGTTFREISISNAVKGHFKDIEHDINKHDLTYENSQARERTQILMDVAGQVGGMVLGTGDLSELALGWCTYNGDHMSMYAVNASVPKTLVRHLVAYFANVTNDEVLRATLIDIIDTPVSPELLPPSEDGEIAQRTEDKVGPYALHDFFLYYTLRYGFSPSKIYMLAKNAFTNTYPYSTIKYWLYEFYKRFFTQQFKRSCMPDGPKVGSICLSPRGDWRMPSDASASLWLNECENLD